jgi:hypothetical protein
MKVERRKIQGRMNSGCNTYIHGNVTRKFPRLKQTKMSFFSFTESENRRAEQVLSEGYYQCVWEG